MHGRDRQPRLPHVPVRELSPAGRAVQGCSRRSGARLRHPRLGHQPVHRAIEPCGSVSGTRPTSKPTPTATVRSTASVPVEVAPSVAEAVAAFVEGIEGDQHQLGLDRLAVRRGGMPWRSSGIGTPGVHARNIIGAWRSSTTGKAATRPARLHRPAPTGAGRARRGRASRRRAGVAASVRPGRRDARRLPRRGARDARQAGAHATPAHVRHACWRRAPGSHGQGAKLISIWYGWRSNGGITWHEEGHWLRRSRPVTFLAPAGAFAQIGGESGDGVSSPLARPCAGDRSTLERLAAVREAHPRRLSALLAADQPPRACRRTRCPSRPCKPSSPKKPAPTSPNACAPTGCAASPGTATGTVSSRIRGPAQPRRRIALQRLERARADRRAQRLRRARARMGHPRRRRSVACDTPLRAAVDSGAVDEERVWWRIRRQIDTRKPEAALASLSLLPAGNAPAHADLAQAIRCPRPGWIGCSPTSPCSPPVG